ALGDFVEKKEANSEVFNLFDTPIVDTFASSKQIYQFSFYTESDDNQLFKKEIDKLKNHQVKI
ncbi:MAG: hypothetical protein RLZZ628_1074, partial [Bacteroidota bacterium]